MTGMESRDRNVDRFFSLSNDLLCIIGFDGTLRRANPALEHLLGRTEAALRDGSIFDNLHPDDRAALVARLAGAEEAIGVENLEIRCRCGDGTYHWISWSVQPDQDTREIYAVGRDITEHRYLEALRQASEVRRAFLLKLDDALRPLTDAAEIQETAARVLGEQFNATRAFYVALEHDKETGGSIRVIAGDDDRRPDVPSVVGRYPNAVDPGLSARLARGEKLVVRDVGALSGVAREYLERYRALGVQSFIAVPLVKDGGYGAAIGVSDAAPRDWTSEEIALVEAAMERTWSAVERARTEEARHESEARQAFLLKLSDALRELKSEHAVGTVCARLLAEEMHLDRAYFVRFFPERDQALVGPEHHGPGLAPVSGLYPYAAFPEAIKQIGVETPVYDDVANDTTLPEAEKQALLALDFGAWIGCPIRTNAKRVDWALYAVTRVPRHWTANDLSLVQETAERAWAAAERVRAEAALHESEEKFSALFAAAPAPFLILKPDAPRFTITDVNDAYLAATMRTREEVVGRGVFEAYPDNPDDPTIGGVSALRASLERVLATHQPDTLPGLKYDITRPDGTFEERWWNPVNSAVLNKDGEVEAIIHNANDVTTQHRAERVLRESEERQGFLLKLSDALRPLRDRVAVQAVALKLLAERLDVMRASYFEIEEDRDSFRVTARFERNAPPMPERMRLSDFSPALLDAYTSGRTLSVADTTTEGEFVPDSDASETYSSIGVAAWAAVPLVRNGQLVAWLGVHSAIRREWTRADLQVLEAVAERTWAAVEGARAEAALRASEKRYRTLFESIDEAFCIIEVLFNEDGTADNCRYLEANPAFERQTGLAHAIGKTARELIPDLEAHWYEMYGRVALTGESARFEDPVASLGRYYDVYAFRVGDPDERHVAVLFNDITSRKRAEEEREQALLAAESAVKARDEFLSIASHELRNPIAAVKATAQLMQRLVGRDRLDEQRLEKYTRTIADTSDRLALLVNDLLDVSRLQSGQLPIHPEPTDLAELVRHAVEVERIAAAGHRLRLNVEDGHPLWVDPERIKQVIVNLLDNAIKYSLPGGEVRILLTEEETGALVRVQDQGIGLPAESLESIFQPFGRAANAMSSQVQGMGLGLFIARRIAAAHGGRLWAESDGEGQGTTMHLWLPKRSGESREPPPSGADHR